MQLPFIYSSLSLRLTDNIFQNRRTTAQGETKLDKKHTGGQNICTSGHNESRKEYYKSAHTVKTVQVNLHEKAGNFNCGQHAFWSNLRFFCGPAAAGDFTANARIFTEGFACTMPGGLNVV